MINAKKAKKGFTIVELVIVIAVIAILAAVLIPTFTTVVKNAKENAALSDARTAYTEFLSEGALADNYDGNAVIVYESNSITKTFYVTNGEFDADELANAFTGANYVKIDKVTIYVNYAVTAEGSYKTDTATTKPWETTTSTETDTNSSNP